MVKTLVFLTAVARNNERPWFEQHRAEYRAALEEFEGVAAQLILSLGLMDPSVAGLTLRDCTYRFYRDTRFSADKTPYKTHMGLYVAPGGKKAGTAGYYFHVEPGNCLLTGGLYMPDSASLFSMREMIVHEGEEVSAALKGASSFILDRSSELKRLPRDFTPARTGLAEGDWREDLLRLKDLYVLRSVSDAFMTSPTLVADVTTAFATTRPLVDLLNRAVAYAREQ